MAAPAQGRATVRDRIGALHMPLTPGTRRPYTIESLIGSGGMGEVYKAHDGRLNRTDAIKRLIADDMSRFQSEARAIAAINHPRICQIDDVGPDYLVLEYLQGEPLAGPVTQDEAVRLATQIADALHAAHERGILHRDLKPANVMVVRQGGSPHAKLLDFGIARLTGEIEQAVQWSAKAVEQPFPAFINRLIRTFEPSLRRSAAWPDVLKKMNLACCSRMSAANSVSSAMATRP